MTELFEPTDAADRRLVQGAAGLLGDFNRAGVLSAADVHVAERTGELAGDDDAEVRLAVALAVRAVRHGSVGVDLDAVRAIAPDLAWPAPTPWADRVAASALLESGVLQQEHGLVYLDRYHRLERQVADDVLARSRQVPPVVDEQRLADGLSAVRDDHLSEAQEAAAVAAVRHWTTVVTGGPGTGKTTTVARLLALLALQSDRPPAVALTAPTGKAAARLAEAVAEEMPDAVRDRVGSPAAMTLHRLLGWRRDNTTRFRHDRGNRLKYDVVVVDECSMVDLTLMARLLEAVRPDTRLVLVGDPRQLTSVGAGAVLSDLVEGLRTLPGAAVRELVTNYRSAVDIQHVAEALRDAGSGDADGVLAALRVDSDQVRFVETDDPEQELRPGLVAHALRIRERAAAGDVTGSTGLLEEFRLLCAHREGPRGVRHWNRLVEQWLAEETGQAIWSPWYVGRPLLVTANDYALQVYNGETGVAVATDGRLRAWIDGAGGTTELAPGRLDAVDTMHALTIHKSQGSQADEVVVLLPEEGSRLLTRELFYTAVTRARDRLRVVGSEAAVRAAVATRAQRATGLRQRLDDET
ncbi:exodeoxyribonuclease V subunit alpha [Nocardioides coralli]|uniref:exodeoxyribonuclease V subunit alpha n=1 Tax=Nocardioides coralli TaxID=2872154 RepID=UPI001CA39B49|nr:exodeoxyribonuclease V subunit alpha [Nocardioides coralli]QZY29301.1 exodeoxyribonuclease V subunit alpha [Nocardioides coralli]